MRDRGACCFIALITLFLLLAAGLIQAQIADAQTGGPSLSGMVKDASGMAVAFAKVSAKNRATGTTSDVQADASGLFRFPNLAPGDYEVSASAEGLTGPTAEVTISAGRPQTINIALAANGAAPSLSDLGFSASQTQGSAAEQARLDKRSHMLKVHQRFGLITTAPLIATVFTGLAAGGKQTSSTDRDLHAALGSTTAVLYGFTAYYAIFAPKIPGTETRGPIKAHKILAWIHGPGMVLTPILGAMAFSQKSNGEKIHGIASLHAPVAVITAGAYGAAILSVSLKW